MVSKRGLSEVVTAVILILLVLAAIAIIWSFVRPAINDAGEQIGTNCVTLDLAVASCNYTSDNVTVRRNVGGGSLTGYKLIFNDGSTADVTSSLNELASETKTTTSFTPSRNMTSGEKVNVAAVAESGACNPTGTPVTCVA